MPVQPLGIKPGAASGRRCGHERAHGATVAVRFGTDKTKAEMALLLLLPQRFPRPDVPPSVRAVSTTVAASQLVPEPVAAFALEHAPGHVDQRARREEVIPWLRQLGFRVDEARRGAALCDGMTEASLEERVLCALSGLSRERFHKHMPMASPAG